MLGHVAALAEYRGIERGVAGPRTPYPQVKVQPVHFSLDQTIIDGLRRRPALRVDGGQTRAIGRQTLSFSSHRRRPVIGYAFLDGWLFEMPPIVRKLDERCVV